MSAEVLSWALAGLGALVGVPVARWLREVTYRKPDEEALPLPGTRWWVVPTLALTWGLLAWRVLGVGAGRDPGWDSGREQWVQAVVLLTLLAVGLAAVCLAAMDLDVHRLPDRVMWPSMGTLMTGLALAAAVGTAPEAWGRALLAGLVCGAAYLLLALLSLARGSLALGLGDVKLAALLGAGLGWFGWGPVLVGMYAGILAGGAFAVALLLTRRVGLRGDLAYGPPMMVGALLGVLVAPGALGTLW